MRNVGSELTAYERRSIAAYVGSQHTGGTSSAALAGRCTDRSEFGTARPFETVNGVKGEGGTLDVAGATIVAGMVLATSGYAQFGGIPGNVLLAFSVDGT